MGWGSGSYIFLELIEVIKPNVLDDGVRKGIYVKLIPVFEAMDWDTQDECLGKDPAYDTALRELHPRWFEDD